jgi:DNA mismatch repair protein MSH2
LFSQLAKRKAEELEDFGGELPHLSDVNSNLTEAYESDGEDDTFGKFPKQETDEGTALVKSFLEDWKLRVESRGDMDEDEQVAELRRVAEEYKERFEGNEWVKGLMTSF